MSSDSKLIIKCINFINDKINNKINNKTEEFLINYYKNKIPLSQLKLKEIVDEFKNLYEENKNLNEILNIYKSKEVKNSAILLTLACQCECLELIKFLIEQCGINANESIRSTYNHETKIPLIIVNETKIPLIIAIEMKNESMIKYLIEHGADVNDEYYVNECHGEGCCYYYSTPLITAIEEHLDKNLVEYLIEKGANVNYLESAYSCGNFEYEYTPLSIACDSLSIGEDDIIIDEIVECLVDHGADVNVQLQNRIHGMVTPLDIICINGNYESTKKYLIEHGAVANNNKYNN